MLCRFRRAQASGSNAAMLIAIIMGLILLYILFISPEERDALLNDDNDSDSSWHSGSWGNQTWRLNSTLVDEKPGRLDYIKRDTFEHAIPSINLFSQVNSEVIKEVDSIYVKNGVFSSANYSMNFFIENPNIASNMLLTFNIKSGSGNLMIWFNNELIFNNEQKNLNNPIELPKEFLRSDNIITFWVSDVSWLFWTRNEYSLTGIKVVGDIKDISKTQSTTKFWISDEEKNYIEKVTLKFSPECEPNNVGTLRIVVNGNEIYSGVPDCKILNSYDFSGDKLVSGENTLGFSLMEGKTLVDRITVNTDLKEMIYPTYYFELDQSNMDAIRLGKQIVNFTVSFTNDVDFKKVGFFVNARKSVFQTYGGSYSENITSAVQLGTNSFELRPEKISMDIPNLKIQVFKKK